MTESFEELADQLNPLKGSLSVLHKRLSDLMVLQGKTIANQNKNMVVKSLHDVEFKVFSQFGEDGILQYLTDTVIAKDDERIFIEFGVENYLESNTRFLLVNNNWRGLVFDGSAAHIASIQAQDFYWRHDLTAVHAWISRENINQLIADAGFSGQIGLLSIDIDGNDFWVWQAIEVISPIIVVVEWNSIFGPDAAVSVPYDPAFSRGTAHYSHLFHGASISALAQLGKQKGYSLVGSNSTGHNLFFVRDDRMGPLTAMTPAEAYVESKIRESRDAQGALSYVAGRQRLELIAHMPVTDINSGEVVTLGTAVKTSKPLSE